MRREIPFILTFSFGLFIVLSNFVVWERWKEAAESVNNWALIVIAFTYVLGVGNLLRVHGGNIARSRPGWAYSAVTIAGLAMMLLFGVVLWLLPESEGGIDLRFAVRKSVEKNQAILVAAPLGSGDSFDVVSPVTLVRDVNGDGSAGDGDELVCRVQYSYSGAETLPSAPFTIHYDPEALAPLGPDGEPLAAGEPGSGARPTSDAPGGSNDGGTADEAVRAAQLVPVPGVTGLSVAPGALTWEAGPIEAGAFGRARAGMGQTSTVNWFYEAVYVPMQSTMYALLAFFISSAAFRAFRVRSLHAVLLGATAVVVILGSVPLGEAVWSRLPDLVGWIMNDLQTAGKRAILIGAALGAIATGMKMIVGAEKSYLSAE
jgi:hypothetical protein